MKNTIHLSLAVCLLISVGFLSACRTTQEKQDSVAFLKDSEVPDSYRISEQDIDTFVFHARNFLSQSNNLGLTSKEKAELQSSYPEVVVRYNGKKHGKIFIDWYFSTLRQAHLTVSGELLTKKPKWGFQLITFATPPENKSSFFVSDSQGKPIVNPTDETDGSDPYWFEDDEEHPDND